MSDSRIIKVVHGRCGSRRGALLVAGLCAFSGAFLVGQQLSQLIIRSLSSF